MFGHRLIISRTRHEGPPLLRYHCQAFDDGKLCEFFTEADMTILMDRGKEIGILIKKGLRWNPEDS